MGRSGEYALPAASKVPTSPSPRAVALPLARAITPTPISKAARRDHKGPIRPTRASPMQIRPRRSVLYMPGSNARALEKAKSIPTDALILDLEDAVAPEAKAAARAQVCAAIKAGGYGERELVIRINGLATPWAQADLEAAAAAAPDALLLPKPGTGADILRATEALARAAAPDKTRLWAMIETPRAILNLADIASA